MTKPVPSKYHFFDRDLSWLSFNERVLAEAARENVPLMERLRFLSIYSSNLDEFYRVRMPALMALNSLSKDKSDQQINLLKQVNETIHVQQEQFGSILSSILKELLTHQINVLIHQPLPDVIQKQVTDYFFEEVAGFICITELNEECSLFPENNKLYLLVTLDQADQTKKYFILTIPSDRLPRFFSVQREECQYIVFLDDIIRLALPLIFSSFTSFSAFSFKITRDAELDLKDEYEGNLAQKMEKEIAKRDLGLATRFLYESGIPSSALTLLSLRLGLKQATLVEGGTYHNLKDLASLPLKMVLFTYDPWPKTKYKLAPDRTLLDSLTQKDILLHPPYHSYETVVRFFNEAAIDTGVTRIYVTLYRVASDSRIANALIHASRNGKKVTVFIELKARFDEANNILWAKRMKEAGIAIIWSIPELKVHAKIALVKRETGQEVHYFGLLSTGNFNEATARFYTDHVLMTAHPEMLHEMKLLFTFLKKRRKPATATAIAFQHLLVAQFNLQKRFIELIDREIDFARRGLPASILLKMNNLEEQVLISKLYEASSAGVNISLIVRGICCLVPGVKGMSEKIKVIRIIDRYLEHGRVFMFHNNGHEELFLGSADWMNRNIYRRIEVCFPVYDTPLKSEFIHILHCQLKDTEQAVIIGSQAENIPVQPSSESERVQSQHSISKLVAGEA